MVIVLVSTTSWIALQYHSVSTVSDQAMIIESIKSYCVDYILKTHCYPGSFADMPQFQTVQTSVGPRRKLWILTEQNINWQNRLTKVKTFCHFNCCNVDPWLPFRPCSGYYKWKSFRFFLEEPDARPSALEFAQYRSKGHRRSFFLCEFVHAPKHFVRPIDQRANQS